MTTSPASIKVVHIIDRLPPDGAERLLVEVMRYRSPAFHCEVLCLAEGGLLVAELTQMGVPVTVMSKRPGMDLAHVRELYRWLRKSKPAVVHTHLFTADTWGRGCALLARVPGIFATIHSTNTWKSSFHFAIDRVLARLTNRVIACSSEVGQTLLQQGIPERKLVSIANGVDLQRIEDATVADLKTDCDIINNDLVFAVVGRLHPAKGHSDLLPVLSKLKAAGLSFNVLFIGEGELEASLKADTKSLGLEQHIHFTGVRTDVINLLKAVDYLLMPSRWEGLPMTLLESMACGTPAVASRVGGIPEVIEHACNGYLYNQGDADTLFQQLQQLIKEKTVPTQLQKAAQNTIAQRYSAASVALAYEALYHEVSA